MNATINIRVKFKANQFGKENSNRIFCLLHIKQPDMSKDISIPSPVSGEVNKGIFHSFNNYRILLQLLQGVGQIASTIYYSLRSLDWRLRILCNLHLFNFWHLFYITESTVIVHLSNIPRAIKGIYVTFQY